MTKLESKHSGQSLEHIRSLIKRIKSKLCALGFSTEQINKNILDVVNRVLKITNHQQKDILRLIYHKLTSEKCNKKTSYLLAVELDLYLNSIYDNYEEETEQIHLKLQHIGNSKEKQSVDDNPQKKQNTLKFNDHTIEHLREYRNQFKKSFMCKDPFLQGYRNRRLIEKHGRVRQVKLQYLNGDYDRL